jgi:hypothetical protein
MQADAQDVTSFFERKSEIGVNCTKILGNVLSLTSKDPSVPYALYYARHAKKTTIRLAGGLFMDKTSEQDLSIPNTILIKSISDNNFFARLSLERRSTISPKVALSYGLDILGSNESSITETENFFYRNLNHLRVGGGPAMRVMYKINKRIYLTTESSLVGSYGFRRDKTILGLDPPLIFNSNPSSVQLQLPTTLFVGFNF